MLGLTPTKNADPILYYRKISGLGYIAITESEKIVRALAKQNVALSWDKEIQSYSTLVSFIPRGDFITKNHKQAVSQPVQTKIEQVFDKYLKMIAVVEKMSVKIQKTEALLIKMLQEHGLHLKPGSALDSQLLSRPHKIRLHYQESLHQVYHWEAIERLAKKYPVLKKCLRKQTVVDRAKLKKTMPELPPSLQKQILAIEKSYALVQTKLSKPECTYCGGKQTKEGVCKRCGL